MARLTLVLLDYDLGCLLPLLLLLLVLLLLLLLLLILTLLTVPRGHQTSP